MNSPPLAPLLPPWVLFDVGGVLITLRSWEEILEDSGLVFGRDPRAGLETLLASEDMLNFELGTLSVAGFCEAVRRSFGVRLADEEIHALYRRRLGVEMDGMLPLLEELKQRGVRLAGLSDTSPIHVEVLSQFATVGKLETLIASCTIGRKKPHIETFQHALELLKLRPEEVFFVDDREDNVEGARGAGMRAVVFQGAAHLRRELGLPR